MHNGSWAITAAAIGFHVAADVKLPVVGSLETRRRFCLAAAVSLISRSHQTFFLIEKLLREGQLFSCSLAAANELVDC